MKKTFLSLFLLMGLAACESENAVLQKETLSVDTQKAVSCNSFNASLKDITDVLNTDTALLNRLFEYDYKLETRESVILNDNDSRIVKQLISEISLQSETLLTSFDINDITELTDEERIMLSILLYSEYRNETYPMTRGEISENHYVDCALMALGIKDVSEMLSNGIENYIKKNGAKSALKLLAKSAGKSISYVGLLMAAYDFYTCV